MKYEPMVKSLLDTDLYKFSMGQCYHHYLRVKCPWIHNDYINFLRFWHPVFEDFTISNNAESGLSISFGGVQEYVDFLRRTLVWRIKSGK